MNSIQQSFSKSFDSSSQELSRAAVIKKISGKNVQFFLSQERVSALVETSLGYREVTLLPKVFKKLSKEQLQKIVKISQMRLCELDGGEVYKLYCDPQLLGGCHYREAYERLKGHLESHPNPFIVDEILKTIADYSRIDSDNPIAEGLGEVFGEDWPKVTQTLFRDYSDRMAAHLTQEDDRQIASNRDEIIGLHSQLPSCKRDCKDIWIQLECFFTIPQIKRLEPNLVDECIKELLEERADVDRVCINFSKYFDKDEHTLIESYLENWYDRTGIFMPDLSSVLCEIADKKPPTFPDGILTNWDRDESYFAGKYFSVEDGENTYRKQIITVEKRKDVFLIYSTDQTIFSIDRGSNTISISKQNSYKFLSAIKNVNEIEGKTLFLGYKNGLSEQNTLPSGEYTLVDFRESKSGSNRYFVFDFKNWENEVIYQVRTCYDKDSRLNDKVKWKCKTQTNWSSWEPDAVNRCMLLVSEIETLQNTIDLNAQVKIFSDEFTDYSEQKKAEENRKLLFETIKNRLKEEKNTFNSLIDDLAENNLTSIEIFPPGLDEDLQKLCECYNILNISITKGEILKKIVLEVNCDILVNKPEAGSLATLMELFTEAQSQLDQLVDKPVVVVMGFTGSGKSSATCYLLNQKLEIKKNPIGNDITALVEDDSSKPIIGSSLSSSETKYPQGYELPFVKPSWIVDSPGFEDTRGADYELCGAFSTDWIFKHVKNIKSVVVTAPSQIFAMDKGIYLQELIDTVEQRFPGIFDEKAENQLFFLITKPEQVKNDIPNTLDDMLKRYQRESEQNLVELQTKQSSQEISDAELSRAQVNRRVWDILVEMRRRGGIDVIQNINRGRVPELLKKYTRGEFSNPYVPILSDSYMQRLLKNRIEEIAQTWIDYFFSDYPKISPLIQQLEKEKTDRFFFTEEISKNRKEIKRCKNELKELENPNKIREELLRRFEPKESDTITLFAFKDPKTAQLYLREVREIEDKDIAGRQRVKAEALNDIKQPWHSFFTGHEAMRTIRHHVYIDRKYGLFPSTVNGPEQKEDFGSFSSCNEEKNTSRKSLYHNWKTKGYCAKIQGKNFELQAGIGAGAGRRIKYIVKTIWNGKELPSFSITHSIPYKDYYSAKITNLRSTIAKLKKEIETYTVKLNGSEPEVQEKIDELKRKQKNYAIAVRTQHKTANILKKLCQKIVEESQEMEDSLKKNCLEYIRLYDEKFASLLEQAESDLKSDNRNENTQSI